MDWRGIMSPYLVLISILIYCQDVSGASKRVCEHRTMSISCAAGKKIFIQEALYGRKGENSKKVCRYQKNYNTNCAAKSSIKAIRKRCQGRRSCTIRAKNEVFGDPCVGTFKYLEVKYSCTETKNVCENRVMRIGCPPRKIISIRRALYGRKGDKSKKICGYRKNYNTKCAAKTSLRRVRERCQGKRFCSVKAKNEVFGDPCVGTYKYLEVNYMCTEKPKQSTGIAKVQTQPIQPNGQTINVCENKVMRIGCPSGKIISIRRALYGRKGDKSKKICRYQKKHNTKCAAKTSLRRVRERCQGKRFCSVIAKNKVFGDPCVGTYKYLEVNYMCIGGGSSSIKCGENAVPVGSKKCRCKKGFYGNPKIKCEAICRCIAKGDPHYTTFDGIKIHFQGNCKYVLSRLNDPKCAYTLSVKNEHRGTNKLVTLTRMADFKFNGNNYRLLPGKKLEVNGKSEDPCNFVSEDKSVTALCSGRILALVMKYCGIVVEWDGNHALNLLVPRKYGAPPEANVLSGICGSCDGNPENDWITQFGENVKDSRHKYNLIGDSWQIDDDSDVRDIEICSQDLAILSKPLPPCPAEIDQEARSPAKCGIAKASYNGPFKECLAVDEDSSFFDDCVFDFCQERSMAAVCDTHDALIESCNLHGFSIQWKDPACPEKCTGENEQYYSEMSGCQPTCVNPNPTNCIVPPTSGCGCKEGFVLGALGKCVNKDTGCGCNTKYGYYPLEARFTTSDCRKMMQCKEVNGVKSLVVIKDMPPCSEDGFCTSKDGDFKCVCRDGMKGDGHTCKPDCNAEMKYQIITCRRRACKIKNAARVVNIQLEKQLSKIKCKRRSTFKLIKRRKLVVVRKGCQGKFKVGYYENAKACATVCGKNAYFNKRKNKCRCRKGYVGDPTTMCSKMCRCRASGDPHYETYDGQIIHFMGTCKYTLTRLKDTGNPCHFNIEVKNENRRGNAKVSYTRMVDFTMYQVTVRLMKNLNVKINDQLVPLPQKVANGNIYIYKIGKFVKIRTKCGVSAIWDGKSTVGVMVPDSFAPDMEGLCGDCNKIKDDFKTKDGKDVSGLPRKKMYTAIGDSYRVTDDSDLPNTCQKASPVYEECTASEKSKAASVDFCGLLSMKTDSPFRTCLRDMGSDRASEIYDACVIDVCNNMNDPKATKQIICDAMTSIVEECSEINDLIGIHLEKYCGVYQEKCRPDQEFVLTGSSCPATCLTTDDENEEGCTTMPACMCKNDMMEENGKCVAKCGKVVDGIYLPVGTQIMSEDCKEIIEIDENSKVIRRPSLCDLSTMSCILDNGQRICVPPPVGQVIEPKAEEKCDGTAIRTEGNKQFTLLSQHGISASGRTHLHFSVQALTDVVVGLFPDNDPTNENIYVFSIGAGFNFFSFITVGLNTFSDNPKVKEVLSDKVLKPFWITWADGMLKIGEGTTLDENIITEKKVDGMFDIKDIGISTTITPGYWCFKKDEGTPPLPEPEPETVSKMVCEHKTMRIRCPRGQKIHIQRALYGRKGEKSKKACRYKKEYNVNCEAESSLQQVRRRCENRKSCTIKAKNKVFKDPCVGTFKFLEVEYTCTGSKATPVSVTKCGPNAKLRGRKGNQRCICQRGYYGKPPEVPCQKVCYCNQRGDPHTRTFDGNKIHFQGDCKYTLAHSLLPNDACEFSVEVKNEYRGSKNHVTLTRMADIMMFGKTIRLLQKGVVMINGEIRLDSNDPNFKILKIGSDVRVEMPKCNFYFDWDGKHSISIRVPRDKYGGHMEGLCGDCNGNKEDDMSTRQGKLVINEPNKYSLVGQSYMVNDDSDMPTETCLMPQDVPQCSEDMKVAAGEACAFLNPNNNDSPFATCLSAIGDDKDSYFEDCKMDYCLFNDSPNLVAESVCGAHVEAEMKCIQDGYSVIWRSSNFCPEPKCQENAKYSNMVSGCPRTCQNLTPKSPCPEAPSSGCECMEGFVRSGDDCIEPSGCGCNSPLGYMKVNDTRLSGDCKTEYICKTGGIVETKELKGCHENGICGPVNGVLKCSCPDDLVGDGVEKCDAPNSCKKMKVIKCMARTKNRGRNRRKGQNECRVNIGRKYKIVDIRRQPDNDKRGASCEKQKTYFKMRKRNMIKVIRGCSGRFDVTYTPRKGCGDKKRKCGLNAKVIKKKAKKGKKKGTYYKTCRCKKGFYGNPFDRCEAACECSASGDPHFRTYDGQTIHYMGTCTNTLTKLLDPNNPCFFNIEVKLENRKGNTKVSYVHSVHIEHLGQNIYLLKGKKVMVNNQMVRIRRKLTLDDGLMIHFVGKRFIQVTSTKCNVLARFDGKHMVNVMVPKAYADKMNGLCGDCNGIKDDFKTREGTDVSHNPKDMFRLIGDSYMVEEFPFIKDRPCGKTPDFFGCPREHQKEANEKCALFNDRDGPFSACIVGDKKLSKAFFRNCKIDICMNIKENDDFKNSLVCSNLEEYEHMCLEESFDISDWRSPDRCPLPQCGANEEVKRLDKCEPTCNDFLDIETEDDTCSMMPWEVGCFCKANFYRKDGVCVEASQCSPEPQECTLVDQNDCPVVNGELDCTLEVGTSVISSDCLKRYECTEEGIVESMLQPCDEHASCTMIPPPVNRRTCVCNAGFQGDGFNCQAVAQPPPPTTPKEGPQPEPLPPTEPEPKPQTLPPAPVSPCPEGTMDTFVDCSSVNQLRRECTLNIDNTYRIKSVQKSSVETECKESDYGINDAQTAIFVTNGCRGRFAVCYTLQKPQPEPLPPTEPEPKPQTLPPAPVSPCPEGTMDTFVDCSSVNQLRRECALNIDKTYRIKSVQKSSVETECTESDYGINDDQTAIFVTSGCKGRFAVCYTLQTIAPLPPTETKPPSIPLPLPPPPTSPCTDGSMDSVVECNSLNQMRTDCGLNIKTIYRITSVYKSKVETECAESDYGINENETSIFVKNGCKGTFTVCYSYYIIASPPYVPPGLPPFPFPPPAFPPPVPEGCEMTKDVTCASKDNKYSPCDALGNTNAHIIGMEIVSEHNEKCKNSGSYGFLGDIAYVNKGCDATFKLCLKPLSEIPCKKPCNTNAECINGQCRCKKGFIGIDNKCSELKDFITCSASGNINYQTYDGESIRFNGECMYKFTEYKNPNNPECGFAVNVKNWEKKKKTKLSYVSTMGIVFRMKGTVIWLGQKKIKVNGQDRMLPLVHNEVGLFREGSYVRIYVSKCNILVSWNMKMNLVVSVDKVALPSASKYLDGICGNGNGDRTDETSADEIPKQFVVKKKDGERCTSKPCTSKRLFKAYNAKLCRHLNWQRSKSSPMKQCFRDNKNLNKDLSKACVVDSCDFPPPRPRVFRQFLPVGCSEFEMFAFRCRQDQELDFNWRKEIFKCKENKCGTNMEYRSSWGGCPKTCANPLGLPECRLPRVEGCGCKHGYLRDNDKCVPPTECGCLTPEFSYISIGGSQMSNDCSVKMSCVRGDDGKLFIQLEKGPCNPGANCSKTNDKFKCTDGKPLPEIPPPPKPEVQPTLPQPLPITKPIPQVQPTLQPTLPQPQPNPEPEEECDPPCAANQECVPGLLEAACVCKEQYSMAINPALNQQCLLKCEHCDKGKCLEDKVHEQESCECNEGFEDKGNGACEPKEPVMGGTISPPDRGLTTPNTPIVEPTHPTIPTFPVILPTEVLPTEPPHEGEGTRENPNLTTCVTNSDCEHSTNDMLECRDGKCQCKLGYGGEPDEECVKKSVGTVTSKPEVPNGGGFQPPPAAPDCECGDNEECNTETGQCSCIENFARNENGLCEELCSEECDTNAKCINGQCTCNTGYKGSGQSCIRACSSVSDCADSNAKCVDEECVCAEGYTGNGYESCSPVELPEECADGQINDGEGNCIALPCSTSPCKNDGTCTDSGTDFVCGCTNTWLGPTCEEPNLCGSDPCMNGGECTNSGSDFNCKCARGYGGKICDEPRPCELDLCQNGATCTGKDADFKCICAEGYTGPFCEDKVLPCASMPCENAGTCTSSGNDFICTCPDTWSGKTCEEPNPCGSNPCSNGGECTNSGIEFSCKCARGYGGKTCNDPKPCELDPCQNGGSCTSVGSGFTCDCAEGYTGLVCEVKVLPCASSPCENGGSCTNSGNTFTCKCEVGWTGADCTVPTPCDKKPCKNGALCTNSGVSFTCSCTEDWKGPTCEERKLPCESSPCKNGGTCTNKDDTYICACAKGWTGPTCEEQNPCDLSPCKNGGTCESIGPIITCKCAPGWKGVLCDEPNLPCDESPCKNGAQCQNVGSSYECTCAPGWTGITCIVPIDPCEGSPCKNGATCKSSGRDFECKCDALWAGPTCEVSLACGDVVCNPDAECIDNKCKCNEDKPYGNGVDSCSATCGGEVCGEKSECVDDKCTCKSQYYGDGITCKKPCGRNKEECHLENGECKKGVCQCKPGYEGNGLVCQKMCTCSVVGDPTYRTYDGSIIRFMGLCKYTLSKYSSDDGCGFNVEVKNDKNKKNGNMAGTKYLEISIYGITVRLERGGRTLVNGIETELPYFYNNRQLTITYVGDFIMVETSCYVTLQWNGKTTALLTVPKRYSDQLSGLCGNCNGKEDDLKTKEGVDVSKKKDKFSRIGDSYLVVDSEEPAKQSCASKEPKDYCTKRLKTIAKRNPVCGMLLENSKGSPFIDCMKGSPELREQFYKICEQDLCTYKKYNPKMVRQGICQVFEGFAAHCEKKGYRLKRNWRLFAFAPCRLKCGRDKRFRINFNSCKNSCADRNAMRECQHPRMEGCYCRNNMLMSGGKCVRSKDCGCTSPMGTYVSLGKRMTSEDCSQNLKCAKPKKRRNVPAILSPVGPKKPQCHSMAMCGAKNGKRQCVCNPGFKGDGIESCKANEPGCTVSEDTKDCVATTTLKGKCYYKSKHDRACNFNILMVEDQGQSLAYVIFNKTYSIHLRPGKDYGGCADFAYLDDNILKVQEKVCDCPSKGLERFKTRDECSVKESTKDCDTTIILEGKCFYKSRNRDCKYTTVIVSELGEDVAYLQFKGESEERKLNPGEKATGCAKFQYLGKGRLKIVEKVCDCKQPE